MALCEVEPLRTKKQASHSEEKRRDRFKADVTRGLESLADLDGIDVVVGIPFHGEADTLRGVVTTAIRGLERAGLSERALVLCVGPEGHATTLRSALRGKQGSPEIPTRFFLHARHLEGRGWAINAIMDAASRFAAPLLLLAPDLVPQAGKVEKPGRGFSPLWVTQLLEPVCEHGQDLALARFSLNPLAHPVESLLAFPMLTGVFGLRVRQPTPGVFAMSHKLVRACLPDADTWSAETGTYGFDPWPICRALAEGMMICEVPLGVPSFRHEVGKLKLVFHQVAQALLHQVVLHDRSWVDRPVPVARPREFGSMLDVAPHKLHFTPDTLRRRFKLEFNHYDHTLFPKIVPGDLLKRMERLADQGAVHLALDDEEWIEIVREFVLAYGFESEFHPDDIVDGLFAFFLARLARSIDEVTAFEKTFRTGKLLRRTAADAVVRRETEYVIQKQTDRFVDQWPQFRQAWLERKSAAASYLPRIGAWEFVPNVGVIVPLELTKKDGGSVWASQIYQELIDRYRNEFTGFISEHLGIVEAAASSEILQRVHQFMHGLDRALDSDIFPQDLTTVDGTREITEDICRRFVSGNQGDGKSFQLTPEAAENLLTQIPPNNLLMRTRCDNVRSLLDQFDPNDALATAAWTDQQNYLQRVMDYFAKEGDATWFHRAPMRSVVVGLEYLGYATELSGTAGLARLAGRMAVVNLQPGLGGEFPKLWFFLKLIQSIIGVELFSEVWENFAAEKDFRTRVVSSIRGHWGRHVLSAHNAFENRHQRILVDRVKRFAAGLDEKPHSQKTEAARFLRAAMEVYHLSITLPDATFVPLSAWTWASFSARGGMGPPTPLSSLVERDWSTREFLTLYMKRAGLGAENTIDQKIMELMGDGREPENLRDHLLGVRVDPDQLVVAQAPSSMPPASGALTRMGKGPLLEPVPEHAWESRYVLNPAALRLGDTVYILYRAFGEDEVSRIGLAWSHDGVHIDGRCDRPIFEPVDATEAAGCEDPRVTVIGDRIYMLYTAWDKKIAQIAMASIPVQAFIERRFDEWERHGLGFPGLANKDAVLYPEKFDGSWVVYHRIDPNMWVSYLESLTCPWPRTGQQIVTGPRSGMMWDGIKIGAGAQPIKTTHGWLNIYHGVDYERTYRLGVLFMDLADPARVIYQSPNPILAPETDFEIGTHEGRDYWVPHVVFACGAVPAVDKAVIEPEDEIFVYYGAADTSIGVAKGKLRDLVPVLNGRGS